MKQTESLQGGEHRSIFMIPDNILRNTGCSKDRIIFLEIFTSESYPSRNVTSVFLTFFTNDVEDAYMKLKAGEMDEQG